MTSNLRSALASPRTLVPIGAVVLLSACGGTLRSESTERAPRDEPPRTVLAIQLSPEEQGRLRASLRGGLVVARLGSTLELLYDCKPPIGYRYVASYVQARTARVEGAHELSAMLPFAAPSFGNANELTLETEVAGIYEAGRPIGSADWFQGACEGATHYVSVVDMGAFEATARKVSGESGAPSASASPPVLALHGGTKEACSVPGALEGPPSSCDAPIRLELVRLPHAPCPRYAVLRDGVCRSDAEGVAPPGREPFQVSQQGEAPPGLAPAQVEHFVRPREREVAAACWDGKYPTWESASVQLAVSVTPGGTAVPGGRGGGGSGVTVELKRAGGGGVTETDSRIGKCVEAVVSSWRFPTASTPTWLLLNFQLRSTR